MSSFNKGKRVIFSTFLLLFFVSCQETEFYEKPELLAQELKDLEAVAQNPQSEDLNNQEMANEDYIAIIDDGLISNDANNGQNDGQNEGSVGSVGSDEGSGGNDNNGSLPLPEATPVVIIPTPEPSPEPIVILPAPTPIPEPEPIEIVPTPVPVPTAEPTPIPTPAPIVEEEHDDFTLITENYFQKAEETSRVDILWVIDNSGSMADEQANLAKNFGLFIQDFLQENVDFKMAITTTDGTATKGDGREVTGSMLKLNSEAAATNEAQFVADFMKLVQVGTSGSGTEMGMQTATRFMDRYASSWLRDDAYLVVVVMSDEEEQGPKTIPEYVNQLRSLKSNPGFVKVNSVIETTTPAVLNSCGSACYRGERYKEASNLTGGTISDIHSDFAQILTKMGSKIVELLHSFALAARPSDLASIKVFVNDQELASGWSYDEVNNAIRFDDSTTPDVGAKVTVEFKVKK